MTLSEAKARAVNSCAFREGDRWLVIQSDGAPIESHRTYDRAVIAAGWLRDHEARCGRPTRYTVQEVTP